MKKMNRDQSRNHFSIYLVPGGTGIVVVAFDPHHTVILEYFNTKKDLKVPEKSKLKCLGFTYNGALRVPRHFSRALGT
jgi:hypothetical protein